MASTDIEQDLVEQGRSWIADCMWGDLEPEDVAALSPEAIRRGIDRHYAGGWAAFADVD